LSNFNSTTGLVSTVFVAGTSLIGLKLVTDFIGDSINNTQKSLPKSKKKYKSFGYDSMYGYSKKSKKQDIFSIKF